MQIKSHITPQTGAVQKDMPALVKKIGKTTHVIRVYFNETNRETMSDKINRMLKNEITQMRIGDNNGIPVFRNAWLNTPDNGL